MKNLLSCLLLVVFVSGCGGMYSSIPESNESLVDRLKYGCPKETKHGTIVMLVVDSSGSMASKGSSGAETKTKIENAQESILNVVAKASDFSNKNKDKSIQIGIMSFSSWNKVEYVGDPNIDTIRPIVLNISPAGGTNIGDAMYHAKIALNASGYDQKHMIIVTDGENTGGKAPEEIAKAMKELTGDDSCAILVIGFDVHGSAYKGMKQYATVLNAADSKQLNETLDFVLDKKILLEK